MRDGEEEDDDDDEPDEPEGEGEDDEGNEEDEDDYTRLQGAVARHRQVLALAAGVPYIDNSSKNARRPPSSSRSRSMQKRISKARIEAIENVIPPEAGDSGWLPPPASAVEASAIYSFILQTLKGFTARGRRCAQVIESLPQDKEFLDKSDRPTSLSDIEARLAQSAYKDARVFEEDMCQMFTTFRRGYNLGTPEHGDVCILQRVYQRMTRSRSSASSSTLQYVQHNLDTGDVKHYYSTVPFGPGGATRGQGTDLTTRPVIRGKIYFTHALHKGHVFQVGDWIHLMNPSDPSVPTLAQIFKICKREDESDQPPLLSCCWYFRPEQTIHGPSRHFMPEEVFKTGLFADHAVDDVLEKVHVLFYTKWTKARPPRSIWDPKAPLYYCEARYNERTYEFNKIKNWNSCLPEELRGSTDQHLNYFPEPLPQSTRISSPFLRGVKGPGRLCEETEGIRGAASPTPGIDGGTSDSFTDPSKKKRRVDDVGAYGQMPRFSHPGMSPQMMPAYGMQSPCGPSHGPGPSPGPYALPPSTAHAHSPPPTFSEHQANQQQQHAYAILRHYAQTLPGAVGKGEFNRIQQLFNSPAAMTVDLYALSAGIGKAVDVGTLHKWRAALQTINSTAVPSPSVRPLKAPSGSKQGVLAAHHDPIQSRGLAAGRPPVVERSLEAALGGLEAYWQPLPVETVGKFSVQGGTRGGAKTVQWFPAPPVASHTGNHRSKYTTLKHSLDYLYFRAQLARFKGRCEDKGATSAHGSAVCIEESKLLHEIQAALEGIVDFISEQRPPAISQRAENEESLIEQKMDDLAHHLRTERHLAHRQDVTSAGLRTSYDMA